MKDNLLHRKLETRNTYGDDSQDLYGMAKVNQVVEFIKGYGIKPIFLCITGSHMWNLATPESDLDIRGVYIQPTELSLSINKGADTVEALNIMGKDIDIQLYEVEKAFRMLNNNNGNLIEMFLSPTVFYQTKDVDWQDLGKKHIAKSLANYYKGYYHSQRQRAARNRGGKALTYTYREIYQGIWLMRHKELVHDFYKLKRKFEKSFKVSSQLDNWLERKTWNEPVGEEQLRQFENEWEMLKAIFDGEIRQSTLPDKVDYYGQMNEVLLDIRKKNWS